MEANSVAAAASPPAPPRAPLGELDMNEFPQPGATTIAAGVSNHHHHSCLWTIHSLKIPGSKDAIDLMKHKDYDLVLPPKLYPPSWDERKSIVKAITEAAMHQGKPLLHSLPLIERREELFWGATRDASTMKILFISMLRRATPQPPPPVLSPLQTTLLLISTQVVVCHSIKKVLGKIVLSIKMQLLEEEETTTSRKQYPPPAATTMERSLQGDPPLKNQQFVTICANSSLS